MEGSTILVPVHNGCAKLVPLVEALVAYAENPAVMADLPVTDLELLLVDDGSTDGTWETICSLSGKTRSPAMRIRGLRFGKNHGQQYALLSGLTECRGRRVITMDDDLSHPPELIPALLKALDTADLAYASPPIRPGRPVRRLASRLHQLHMSFLTGTSPAIRVGSYRALSPSLVSRILAEPASWPYLSAVALGLRPRPETVMVTSGPWKPVAGGRFSPANLFLLEIRIFRHHSGLSRTMRRRRQARYQDSLTAGEFAGRLISGRTDP